ncbi:hypothetical protein BP5796_02833 [Coleophoma crateriformis]|uniref:DUF6594 domain-containing protein n=1 Tax=Coleophoma crateriformis TaxID=565419 RepID=A0A3D8T0Y6_9HELO|nr:hypothetical protein BP5796_02833 [Coleophoma crateriformis]
MSSNSNIYDAMEKGEAIANNDDEAGDLEDRSLPASPTSATTLSGISKSDTLTEVESRCKIRHWVLALKSTLTNLIPKSSHSTSTAVPGSAFRILGECPKGYPRLAAFLDSDENFMLYRRFGYLQARILLYKQDELRSLEQELDHLDKLDAEIRPKRLRSRERDDGDNQERRNLILKISDLWKEYAELLKTARELTSFNRPASRDYESVTNHFNQTSPLCFTESYIYHKEDIITIKPGRETAWLDAIVEKILQKLHCSLIQVSPKPPVMERTDTHMARERINCAVALIIVIMILSLLIVPVYLLWHLTKGNDVKNTTAALIIGILLMFTLVFSGVLSLFTRAKRHEVFAAAAGYCAVLVVFIGNIGQFSP